MIRPLHPFGARTRDGAGPLKTGRVGRDSRPEPPGKTAVSIPPPLELPLSPAPGGTALSRCRKAGGDDDPHGLPFEWTLNPYRGCELACTYCYARYSHAFLGLADPRDFERKIFFKEDLPRLLSKDLERRVLPGQRIAVGTVTDPYQPLERRREITRSCLRVMARREGLRLSITTKSDLVVRDLDLLRVLARKGSLHVNLSLTTLDRRLARVLEPRAPTPARRLAALRALAAEGIETGVFLMPILPGLTDASGMLEEVVQVSAAAGARYLVPQVLFLREPTRSLWLENLRDRFPALVARYRTLYADGPHVDGEIREGLLRRVARARRGAGLADAPTDTGPRDPQLRFSFLA